MGATVRQCGCARCSDTYSTARATLSSALLPAARGGAPPPPVSPLLREVDVAPSARPSRLSFFLSDPRLDTFAASSGVSSRSNDAKRSTSRNFFPSFFAALSSAPLPIAAPASSIAVAC